MFQKQVLSDDWYIFRYIETHYIKPLALKIPKFIETYHLTYVSLIWSIGVIYFGYLTSQTLYWIWGISFCLMLHYITDILDGEVGRARHTGLIRWGFYMDHFLDFIFLSCLFLGYFFFLEKAREVLLILYFLIAAFMVHAVLRFSTGEPFNFSFYGIGPSEFRALAIVLNTIMFFFGERVIIYILYSIVPILFLSLIYTIYTTQKIIWKIDMSSRNRTS